MLGHAPQVWPSSDSLPHALQIFFTFFDSALAIFAAALPSPGLGHGNRNNPSQNTSIAEADLTPFRNGKFLGTCSMAPHVICTATDLPCPATGGNCNDNTKCSQFPACPSATSAICCDQAGNKFVLRTYTFSEYALGLDLCDPVAEPQLKLSKIAAPAGDDKLTFKGKMTLPAPLTGNDLDPLAHGLRIVMSDAPGPVVDLGIPPDAYDPVGRVGWKVNKAGTKWVYLNKSTQPPAGIFKIVLKDKSARTPGLVQVLVKGKRGTYPATLAVMPTLVLPDAGRCFAAAFPGPAKPVCVLDASGKTLKCK